MSEYDFYFSIGGPISYDILTLKDFVQKVSLSPLILETDALWLTQTSLIKEKQNIPNEPAFLVNILEELAKILKIDSSTLEDILFQNTLQLFPTFSEIINNQEGVCSGKD